MSALRKLKRAVKRTVLGVAGSVANARFATQVAEMGEVTGRPCLAFLRALDSDPVAYRRAVDGVERIMAGERRCFSKEWRFAGDEDWHLDPFSGRRWPLVPAKAIDVNVVEDDSDVQSPWETSRLEHVWRVALSARLSGSDEQARWVIEELASWERANPLGTGVNWTVDMEVALRGATLAEIRAALHELPAWTPTVEARITRLIAAHALWALGGIGDQHAGTQNHHLVCVVALLGMSAHLEGFAPLAERREWLRTELESCVAAQVLADGVDFENAIGYHLLVAEVLGFAALWIADRNWWHPADVLATLGRMVAVGRAMRWSDGRVVAYGDDDDDFVSPTCCGYFSEGRPRSAESLWVAYRALGGTDEGPAEGPQAFREGGLYLLADGGMRVYVNAMPTGVNGEGPHRHNDPLSFCLEAAGREIVTDRGTYRYQSSHGDRLRYRGIASHASVQVDQLEPNDISRPFALAENRMDIATRAVEFAPERQRVHAGAELTAAVGARFVHERDWELAGGSLVVRDRFESDAPHTLTARWPLAPGLKPTVEGAGDTWIAHVRGVRFEVGFDASAESASLYLEPSTHSVAYRVQEPALTLVARWHAAGPSSLVLRVVPEAGER